MSTNTGGAWLSSARVVRCWVKSRNERSPYLKLNIFKNCLYFYIKIRRKEWKTSSPHALYALGYTRATMDGTINFKYKKNLFLFSI